ncbi:MAG: hypothetical protein WCB91_10300, partial [Halobacteriota archaeon]
LTVRSDATWSSRLSVGTIFGVGKTFQIDAVVADQSASTALSGYAAQRMAITKLPPGAQAVDAVTVKRVAADVTGAIGKPLAQRRATHGVNRWIERDRRSESFYSERRSSECSCK